MRSPKPLKLTYKRDGEVFTIDAPLIDILDAREPATREVGGLIFVSTDHGETWARVNENPVGGSPAYYYGQIRFDPKDAIGCTCAACLS